MFFSKAVSGYLLHRSTELSPETIKTERVWLNQFSDHVGNISVGDVEPHHVRDFLLHQKERGLSPFSVRRCHTSLSAFYTWATHPEIELAETDPTDHVPPPRLPKREPRGISQQDVEALLDAASEMRLTRRSRALVLFLLDSACRVSEVCGVRMKDIDLETGRVLVEGKGSKQRYITLGRRARSAVWLYVENERPEPAQVDENRLFLLETGDPMDRFSLRESLVRLASKASQMTGREIHATPHWFRHQAAVQHLSNGMDLVSLQTYMGHESIDVTRGYLDSLTTDRVSEVAKRTSPSDNWRL